MKKLLITSLLLISGCSTTPPMPSSPAAEAQYQAALQDWKRCATEAADGYASQPGEPGQVADAALGKCMHQSQVAEAAGERMAVSGTPAPNHVVRPQLLNEAVVAHAHTWLDLKAFLTSRVMDDRSSTTR